MREILFRGKRIAGHRDSTKEGTMLYGSLFTDKNGQPKIKWYNELYGASITSNVDPETVGQFTGLTDKNGKKIFEGDIVEGHCHSRWRHDVQRCEIAYWRDGFEVRHHVQCGGESRYYTYKVLFSNDVVVIGNIHDNPELLEVTDNA